MGKRVVFTGGSGKAGRHVVPYLQQRGHQVLNLDRVPLDLPGVNTLIVDLADSGQTFNALSSHYGFEEYFAGAGRAPVDGKHLAIAELAGRLVRELVYVEQCDGVLELGGAAVHPGGHH